MCGILLVQSSTPISLDHHLAALRMLEPRGPDFSVYRYHSGVFIGQTVLHITGSADYYHQQRSNFLAYNGEIYNYRQFGQYSNDIELVHDLVPGQTDQFRQLEGQWAWAWTDFDQILYATDPQGEKVLYRYQDDELLIVCSEITPILHYRKLALQTHTYTTKHWPILDQTPWQGIERIKPGVMYSNNGAQTKLDSMFDWHTDAKYPDIESAAEEFDQIFSRVLRDMTPDCDYGCTFSGGVDSASLVAALDQPAHLYTVNVVGKETVAVDAQQYLTDAQRQRLVQIDIDESAWAMAFLASMRYSQLPAQSWSFVGQWIVSQHCQERVLFTGVGADELFGGYDVYQTLPYTQDYSVSPYSYFTDDSEMLQLWQQCLDFYDQDPAPATPMMDYMINCSAVDLRGVDVMTQAHGVEPRSPFVHPSVIKFAINLPWEYRVGIAAKPVVKNFLQQRWPGYQVLPKQGFAGHCNDSAEYLGIELDSIQDRHQAWKKMLLTAYRSVVL